MNEAVFDFVLFVKWMVKFWGDELKVFEEFCGC